MKKIASILKNKEIMNRILFTVLILFIFRIGAQITVPGVNPEGLEEYLNSGSALSLMNLLGGGTLQTFSIFALGVSPYITAQIIVQLLSTDVLPALSELKRQGQYGRRKIEYATRYLTLMLGAVQAYGIIKTIENTDNVTLNLDGNWLTYIYIIVVMLAGSMLVMWLGDQISVKGIGNGISIIILVGILARLPGAFMNEFTSRLETSQGGLVMLLVEIVIMFAVTAGAVMLTQGTRKVPVQYAKRIVGNKQYGGARQYIPLKVNAANVMPIIFAQALMFIPITLAGFGARQDAAGVGGWIARNFGDMNGVWYNIIYFLMIVAFTYFYTAITVRPTQMAEEMKKNSGFIPGIKPGKKTAEYLDSIMSRITLPGSLFLGIVAILPAFARYFGINQQFAQFFGGTSLLITVGVVLDTLQQIETHLMMHHYDGLMKSGKLKGRNR